MDIGFNPRPALLRAGLLMTLGALLTAIDATIVKIVAADLHPLQIYFFRCLVALAVMSGFILRGRIALSSNDLALHVVRAVLKLVGMVTLMFALTMLPIATVTSIGFAAPIFVSVGAILWFGEPARARHVLGLVLGFCGVLIVVRPTAGFDDVGSIVAIGAAVMAAAATLLMKYSSSRDPVSTIVALNLVISVPISLLASIPVWTWPSPSMLVLLLLQGVLAALCQFCVVAAHSLASATTLMPLDFLRLPAAIVMAYLVFAEMPDLWTIVGAAIIFIAGIVPLRNGGPRRNRDADS